jgi:hypothetical protein
MTMKKNRTIRPVNGIGPGATIGARKLAERRAEKLARERRNAATPAAAVPLTSYGWHYVAQRELDASAIGEEADP